VIERMGMALTEACELIQDNQIASGPVEIEVSFDEYILDAAVSYEGTPLPLPEKRPGEDEILSDPSAFLRLGGFLIRGYPDRVSSVSSGPFAILNIPMEH
jgi:xanthine permease XanP